MRAILFDLDGTLLDIDIDAFMSRYFGGLQEYTQSVYPGDGMLDAVLDATGAMMGHHPGVTNQEAFYARFLSSTGIDLEQEWDVFQTFYEEHFDAFRGDAGPVAGARQAVDAARDLGLKVAVATNPMFPMIAVEKRMGWAGLDRTLFDLVTTYETMEACKPHPAYFLDTARALGVEPQECLMVGDDPSLDLVAEKVGMSTFYVGGDPTVHADHTGSLRGLAEMLPRLVEGS